MKRCLLLCFSVLILAAATQAQISDRERRERAIAAEEDVQREELVSLERETAHALAIHNPSFFRRVYADDFSGVVPGGEVVDRNELATRVQNSTAQYASFLATDIHVRIYEATAIVTCTWTARGIQLGHPFSRQYRVLHVYSNGVNGWKVIASQEMLLPG
jgi:hypothetical protein